MSFADGELALENSLPQEINLQSVHGENQTNTNENSEALRQAKDADNEEKFLIWYESVCEERTKLLAEIEDYKNKLQEYDEVENGYKKRVKELETNSDDLLKAFEEVQREVQALRDKYEPNESNGNTFYNDSYKKLLKENENLKKSENKQQERIKNLDDEVVLLKKSENKLHERIKNLDDEVVLLRKYVKDIETVQETPRPTPMPTPTPTPILKKPKVKKNNVPYVVITETERVGMLEQENANLKYKNEILELDIKAAVERIQILETQAATRIREKLKTQRHNESMTNKKRTPAFLPKLPDKYKPQPSDDSYSDSFTPRGMKSRSSCPSLMFGLNYVELQQSRHLVSRRVSSDTESWVKYAKSKKSLV